jgi:hypothetical protein
VTDYDRAIWIGFISNQIGTAQLANVLLLLYAPIDAQGIIDTLRNLPDHKRLTTKLFPRQNRLAFRFPRPRF